MKNLLGVFIILSTIVSFSVQATEGFEPYLSCLITSDGVNPHIPRKFEAYINYEQKNWLLVYNVAGVPIDEMKRIATGDIYQNKQTKELTTGSFFFEDGSNLQIDFRTGKSESDNVLFSALERAELKNCQLL